MRNEQPAPIGADDISLENSPEMYDELSNGKGDDEDE